MQLKTTCRACVCVCSLVSGLYGAFCSVFVYVHSSVTPVWEATDHRPKEVDRQQRIIGTQTEHMEEAQYQEVAKKVEAHS